MNHNLIRHGASVGHPPLLLLTSLRTLIPFLACLECRDLIDIWAGDKQNGKKRKLTTVISLSIQVLRFWTLGKDSLYPTLTETTATQRSAFL